MNLRLKCWKQRDRPWTPPGSTQTVAQGKLTLSVPKAVGRFVIHPLMMSFFSTNIRR